MNLTVSQSGHRWAGDPADRLAHNEGAGIRGLVAWHGHPRPCRRPCLVQATRRGQSRCVVERPLLQNSGCRRLPVTEARPSSSSGRVGGHRGRQRSGTATLSQPHLSLCKIMDSEAKRMGLACRPNHALSSVWNPRGGAHLVGGPPVGHVDETRPDMPESRM